MKYKSYTWPHPVGYLFEIRTLIQGGSPLLAACQQMDVSLSTVRRWCEQFGLTPAYGRRGPIHWQKLDLLFGQPTCRSHGAELLYAA